jgi:transposase-like protein
MLGEGKDVADVCRELQVSEQTYYRWRNQFGGLKADDAKRLKDLERENSTLKRLLADAELEKAALKEIAGETSRPGTPAGSRSSPDEDHEGE